MEQIYESINIPLVWTPVLVNGEKFKWHQDTPKSSVANATLAGPKVYRWIIRDENSFVIYIGETENFRQRIKRYRTIKRTDLMDVDDQVVNSIRQCEENNGSVDLEFLDLDSCKMKINDVFIDNKSLSNHDVRLMFESIAIFTANAEKVKLLNHIRMEYNLSSIMKPIMKSYKEIEKARGKEHATKFIQDLISRFSSMVSRAE